MANEWKAHEFSPETRRSKRFIRVPVIRLPSQPKIFDKMSDSDGVQCTDRKEDRTGNKTALWQGNERPSNGVTHKHWPYSSAVHSPGFTSGGLDCGSAAL
jgi:hypothetical protein